MSKLNATQVYYLTRGCFVGFRTMCYIVLAVYYVQIVGMNPLQLVLVGTMLELSALLFEIPTGVVADTFSRKISVIIGFMLIGISYVLQPLLPFFIPILLIQIIAGIGWTFISGALEAWVADEVGEQQAGQLYLRAFQVGIIGGLIGTVIGTGLGMINLALPTYVGGGLLIVLGGLLLFIMPEHGFKPLPRADRNSWQAMGHTLKEGLRLVRGSSLILTILLIGAIFGAFSEGFDRLHEARFLNNFTFPDLWNLNPVIWFGIFHVGAILLNLVATEIVRRKLDTNNHVLVARTLMIGNSLLIASIIGFGLAGNFMLAVLTYWLTNLFRSLNEPLYTAWLNQNVHSQVRATVLSMGSQADALGQFMGGPVLGLIATSYSIGVALVVSGIMLIPAIFLYGSTLRKRHIAETIPENLKEVNT